LKQQRKKLERCHPVEILNQDLQNNAMVKSKKMF